MPLYNNMEMVEMLLILGECGRNATRAVQVYGERFPERRQPSRQFLTQLTIRLAETGSLCHRQRTGRPRLRQNRAQDVLRLIAAHPHTSTRAIGANLGISNVHVWRILKDNVFHPFKVHLHQELRESDYGRRLDFCEWMLQKIDQTPGFLQNVMTTDESTFYRDGTVNRHNSHYWSPSNPHWLRAGDHQENWRVNVWCGIKNDTLLGPVFLEDHLTGESYIQMILEAEVDRYCEELPLADLRSMWFQQDGAGPHFALNVRHYLDRQFPGQWIGRGGPVAWPARSPDLSPMDYFLWGYIKDKIYDSEPPSLNALKERITDVCRSVTPELLERVRSSWEQRLWNCVVAEGRHFEHLH